MQLNCDFGEDFGAYRIGTSDSILDYVDTVNIACGFHAGDPLVMKKTVEKAVSKGVLIGAHPGYQDLQGFGRRNMELSAEEIYALVLYQIGALDGFVKAAGATLYHVKPHGALYNQSANDEKKAMAIIQAVKDYDKSLILYALSGSVMAKLGKREGITIHEEVFADRRYNDDGTLVSRNLPDALIHGEDEMLEHVEQMLINGKIKTKTGAFIETDAKTICVHGDGEYAMAFVKRIQALKSNNSLNK